MSKPTPRACLIFLAIAMLLGSFAHWPYGYYQLLHWVACGAAAWTVLVAHEAKKPGWMWGMVAVAVLFNPLAPIHLAKGVWKVVDIGAAAVLALSLRVVRAHPGRND